MQQMIIISLFLLSSVVHAETGVNIDIKVTPKGDFVAKTSEVTGFATQSGETVKAENIVVKVKNFKTGMSLRDKHMTEKYLEVEKFPEVVLVSASGQGGKGKGRIKVKGIEKDIEGTYKVAGNELTAEFPLKMSDFKITGVKYMGVGANDDMKVHITVPIKKAGAEAKPAAKKK